MDHLVQEESPGGQTEALNDHSPNTVPPVGNLPSGNPNGYRDVAHEYLDAGWNGPVPLRPGTKNPPPPGFTGWKGKWVDHAQIDTWVEEYDADANLGLRVNYGLIGIDVDHYDDKRGGDTLAEAEQRWGRLPNTWRSTARADDPISGIRVYRVPEDVLFKTVIQFSDKGLGHIEIIQPHHRLIVAWPSVHPEQRVRFEWFGPAGKVRYRVPRVDELPMLPQKWVGGLSKDAVRDEVFRGTKARQEDINEKLYRELIALPDDGLPDKVVAARLEQALADLALCRYEATRDHVLGLMRLKVIGRAGVLSALEQLYPAHIMSVTDRTPVNVAKAEFLRFTQGAAALVAATAPGREQTEGERNPYGIVTLADLKRQGPRKVEPFWGNTTQMLGAQGQPLMIAGVGGTGKTTLMGMLARALLRYEDEKDKAYVLGHHVRRCEGVVLYFAMDRPSQILGSLDRQFINPEEGERLLVREGPMPGSIVKDPTLFVKMAESVGAEYLFIDSTKDVVPGLSTDEVGAAYNIARQHVVAAGVNWIESHHTKKESKPDEIDAVFGSTWLTAGCGSVVQLWGRTGSSVVDFYHLKPPVGDLVPKMQLTHDKTAGILSSMPSALSIIAGGDGMTIYDIAVAMWAGDAAGAEFDKHKDRLRNTEVPKLVAQGKVEELPAETGKPRRYRLTGISR